MNQTQKRRERMRWLPRVLTLFALAAAVARERSESVATPVLLHWTALAALLIATL